MRTKCVLEEAATHSGAEGEMPDAGSFGRLRGPFSEQWLVKDCTMVEVSTKYSALDHTLFFNWSEDAIHLHPETSLHHFSLGLNRQCLHKHISYRPCI